MMVRSPMMAWWPDAGLGKSSNGGIPGGVGVVVHLGLSGEDAQLVLLPLLSWSLSWSLSLSLVSLSRLSGSSCLSCSCS